VVRQSQNRRTRFDKVVTVNAYVRIAVLFAAACLLPICLIGPLGAAQDASPPTPFNNPNLYNILQKRWVVAGKVETLQGDPVAGAKVDVQPRGASGAFRSLVRDFQGMFQTDYWLNLELFKEFSVELKVSKKGFRPAHSLIDFGKSDKPWLIPITLRELADDPDLLSQADLISGLASRLDKLKASDGLSAAGGKDYARGVGELRRSAF